MEKQSEQQTWWLKNKKLLLRIGMIALLAVVIVLIILIILGYIFNWDWTGLNATDFTSTPQKTTRIIVYQPGKTLWDWLGLLGVLAIPVVVGFFTFQQGRASDKSRMHQKETELEIAQQQHTTELEITMDNQRENVLQAYIDKMSELLVEKQLRDTKPDSDVRTIARVRTLTVLDQLDGLRKRSIVIFLAESGLISFVSPPEGDIESSIILLAGANFSEANLFAMRLDKINMRNVSLHKANLAYTFLNAANLSGADLSEANLYLADLNGTNLFYANLSGADLRSAGLEEANLAVAKLIATDLRGTRLKGANLWGVTLRDPILARDELSGANLSHTNLNDSNLGGVNLSKANLSEAILSRTNLHGANLSGANLSGAHFFGDIDLSGADLSEANLRGAFFHGKIDLNGANLSRADLSNIQFTYCEINLSETNLKDASGITIEQLEKETTLLKSATMPDGSIHP